MATLKSNNLAGIGFWLKWILLAIGGFTASLFFWNWLLLDRLNADFKNPQIAIAWMVAVFGTWFVILIPLMKKKETVMGHMDRRDESTATWWLIWIALTIGSFFVAVWFWTPFIAKHFGSVRNSMASLLWVIAVFGSWLIALIPLMILMYHKVDKAYEDARIRRELGLEKFKDSVKIKAIFLEPAKRRLSRELIEHLKKLPRTIKNGHLVTARLTDGRTVDYVFISEGKDLLGLYGQQEITFTVQDIESLEPADLNHLPDFTQKIWLRLDGNS